VRHSAAIRAVITKNLGFGICAAALWALLPVIARDQLALDAGGYGLLSGGFGFGAVAGALTLPYHLGRKPLNTVVNSGVLLWGAATLLIALSHHLLLALVGAFGAGMAWVSVFASMAMAVQSCAPAWVRARAVATHFVAVFASLSVGSVLWGALASAAGTRVAMASAAVLVLLLCAAARGLVLRLSDETEVLPGTPMPGHLLPVEPRPGDGPVLIQVEYRIAPPDRDAFLEAAHAMDPIRRRNGASSWRVFRDLLEHDRVVEQFVIASWAEYVRLRTRLTVSDRQLQARVEAFQRPGVEIRVTRLIGMEKH
jgi:MFS family permease